MNTPKDNFAIRNFLAHRSDAENLASSRGLTFGGAGASLAIILLIAQIGVTKTAVSWSLGFASVAFPLWLALALTYDMWLALKLDFNDLNTYKWLPRIQAWCFYSTGSITFLSIAFLLYSLHTFVWIPFLIASFFGLIFVVVAVFAASFRVLHHMDSVDSKGSQSNGGA